jgi:hypothetical protein
MEASIEPKTGKSLDEWLSILKGKKFEKHGEYMAYLKGEHGLTHGYANLIAHKARKSDAGSNDASDMLGEQYSKGKEHLKLIYDKLVKYSASLGADVEVAVKKSSVSIRRKRQFILIQPSTKTRIDLGFKLPGVETTERLESSGPFGSMCTHRVRLENISQIDEELLGWINKTYEMAG